MIEFRPALSKFRASWSDTCHRAGSGTLTLGIALLVVGGGVRAAGEDAIAPGPDAGTLAARPPALGDDELIIREIFHSHLPSTLEEHALRLGVHPHLGDLTNKDHLRITTGVRYGLTAKWEASMSSDLYFSHGRGEVGAFDRYGMANLELGTKINAGQPIFRGWDTAAGFDYIFPTGRPPAELTDGLRHFMPYVTFSHRLESPRGLRVFWGMRLDTVTRTSVPGEFRKNDFHDSSAGVTAGFVIDHRNVHYTFETSFDSTRLIGGSDDDVFMIRPGVIWEILSRRHPGTRSNWVVGAAVSGTSGPAGLSVGGSLKLRYNFDLKRPVPLPTR